MLGYPVRTRIPKEISLEKGERHDKQREEIVVRPAAKRRKPRPDIYLRESFGQEKSAQKTFETGNPARTRR